MQTLSPDQQRALDALHAFVAGPERVIALAGPAGTGKSTLIGRFLRETGIRVHLTATTHKAAAVAASLAGGEAVTVHSLFGLRPVNDHDTGETRLERRREPKATSGSLVVIDEASMVDLGLYARLAKDAESLDLKLLFVGDPYQLPPVSAADGPPAVFSQVPTLALTTVHRQAAGNPIIALATAFRGVIDGAPYPVIRPREPAIRRVDRAAFAGLVREHFTGSAYREDPDACRLLAWTNVRVNDLNAYVRGLLLGADARRFRFLPGETLIVNEALTSGEEVVLPNEARVAVLEARPDRFEDDGEAIEGYRLEVVDVSRERHELFVPDDWTEARRYLARLRRRAQALKAMDGADDSKVRAAWRRFFEAREQFADLRPPHALTVHKSQGSTYGHVLIQVEDVARADGQPGHLMARLLYVAATRAALGAVFYGSLPGHLYGPRG